MKVAKLDQVPAIDNGAVTVVDLRTSQQKAARRDSNFSAIAYLGDAEVKPSAMLLLKSALQKHAGEESAFSLEISELRVIDFFPVRLRAGGRGYLGRAIMDSLVDSKTDFAFVEHLAIPESENSVICLVAGRLNGKTVKTATFRTYKESPLSVSIRNDPSFKKALVASVEAAADDVISQVRAGP
jgi:hypothetical protein